MFLPFHYSSSLFYVLVYFTSRISSPFPNKSGDNGHPNVVTYSDRKHSVFYHMKNSILVYHFFRLDTFCILLVFRKDFLIFLIRTGVEFYLNDTLLYLSKWYMFFILYSVKNYTDFEMLKIISEISQAHHYVFAFT